jgi:ATP-binding cassette, subfamily B, bacterial PglK
VIPYSMGNLEEKTVKCFGRQVSIPARGRWKIVGYIRGLLANLSQRRFLQISVLFSLQLLGAFSEVVSLGAVIPFLGVLANAEGMLNDALLKPWLEFAGIFSAASLIIAMAVMFGAAVIFANGIRLVILWVQAYLGAAIASDLSVEVYRRTLNQPYSFHLRMNSSTLISAITQDLSAALNVIQQVFILTTNSLVVIAIVAALMYYNIQFSIVSILVSVGAYSAIMALSRGRLLKNSLSVSDNAQLRIKALQEGLGGIRDVRIDGTQRYFLDLYSRADRPMRRSAANNRVINVAPRYFLEMFGLVAISVLAVVLIGGSKGIGEILPTLGAFAMAANRLLPALQQCYQSITNIRGAEVSIERTLDILNFSIDPLFLEAAPKPLLLARGIRFKKVWFRYERDSVDEGIPPNWVLRDLSFTVPAMTTVAFVGSTGSGKSTISDLILGLLRPQRGEIEVDEEPLSEDRIRAWQSSIAHVPQNIYLADASVAENIAFGCRREEIDMARVREAAKLAQIDEFVMNRAKGYDEVVGERGIRVSGGQRQRIGIARALYKRASVIVFDEATSALDNLTEQEVMAAIGNLSRRITVVLIAHRLSTIRNADRIYEVKEGQIVASGTFDEVVEMSEGFRLLAQPK